MGRRATITPRKKGRSSYEFRIFWQGKTHRPSLNLHEHAAKVLADRLQTKLDLGTLDIAFLSSTFPRYFSAQAPTLGAEEAARNTIAYRIAAYVALAWDTLKPSNRRPFASHQRFWLAQLGAETTLEQLPAKLEGVVHTGKAKTRAAKRAFLRGVLALAKWDITVPGEAEIAVLRTRRGTQRPKIDPFSEAERDRIIGWFERENATDAQREWGDYLTVAFYSGIRPGEQYAQRWDRDIDWVRNELIIQWAVSGEIEIDETKTNCLRRVWIHPMAMAALKRQRARTQFAKHGHLWQLPGEGMPVVNQKALWNIWQKALKAVGVRVRKPYTTRHTYATLLLMAGANPEWVARQMGHSVITLRKHYGTWIDGPRDQAEIAKVLAFTGGGVDIHTDRRTV